MDDLFGECHELDTRFFSSYDCLVKNTRFSTNAGSEGGEEAQKEEEENQ